MPKLKSGMLKNNRALAGYSYFKNGKHADELELLQKAVLCVRSKSTEFFQVAANLLRWQNEPGKFTREGKKHCGKKLDIRKIEQYLSWVLEERPPQEINRNAVEIQEAPRLFREYMSALKRRMASGELDEIIRLNALPAQEPPRRRHFGRPLSPALVVARI
jgi:hypothetical protein